MESSNRTFPMIPRANPAIVSDLVPVELKVFRMSPVDLSPEPSPVKNKDKPSLKTTYGPLPTEFFKIQPREPQRNDSTSHAYINPAFSDISTPRTASEVFEKSNLKTENEFGSSKIEEKSELSLTPQSFPMMAEGTWSKIPEVVVTPPLDLKPTFGSTRTLNKCCVEQPRGSWTTLFNCWKPKFPRGEFSFALL